MKKSTIITLLILSFVLIASASVTFYLRYQDSHKILEETEAIFSIQPGEDPYTDLLGNPVVLSQYLGRVMVVTSWASWSPFTANDFQTLIEVSKKYSREEVAVLAINRKETKEQATRYVSTLPEISGILVVLDPSDTFYNAVGGYAMPETVIYNERGEVVQHFRGVTPLSDIVTAIDAIITK